MVDSMATYFVLVLMTGTSLITGDSIVKNGTIVPILAEVDTQFNLSCFAEFYEENEGVKFIFGKVTVYQSYPPHWTNDHLKDKYKYNIHHIPPYQYVLQVNRARPDDAATYTCELVRNHKYKRFYDVFILNHPELQLSDDFIEGKMVRGQCGVTFYKLSNDKTHKMLIRVYLGHLGMTFKTDPKPKIGENENDVILTQEFEFKANRSLNKKNITCGAELEGSDQRILKSLTLNIHYGPKNIRISPNKTHYQVGDIITCFADANPPPQYQWTSFSQKKGWVIQGPYLFVLKNMSGMQNWSCECLDHPSAPGKYIGFTITENHRVGPDINYTICVFISQVLWTVIAIWMLCISLYPIDNWQTKWKRRHPQWLIQGHHIHLLWTIPTGISWMLVGASLHDGAKLFSFIIGIVFLVLAVVIFIVKRFKPGCLSASNQSSPTFSGEGDGLLNEPDISANGTGYDHDGQNKDSMELITKGPVCIVYKEGSELKCNEQALNALRRVNNKLVVVAITGIYRSGKSYLMNCLAGKYGFELGATVEKKTSGIWLWVLEHSKMRGVKLVLIDTEGLTDPQTQADDKLIFTLAALFSSTLIHNAQRVIDSDMVSNWNFVSEFRKRITNPEDFDLFAPNLVVTLRDFTLILSKDGESLSPNQYFEDLLEMKTDRKEQYNKTREHIRDTFKDRQCFLFDPPASRKALKSLGLPGSAGISEEFVEDVENFKTFVLTKCLPMQLQNGEYANGSVLATIISYCVNALNQQEMVDTDKMLTSIVQTEVHRAWVAGENKYKAVMEDKLGASTPSLEQLQQYHREARRLANKAFVEMLKGTPSDGDKEGIQARIDTRFKKFESNVRERSKTECKKVADKCGSKIRERINDGSYRIEDFNHDLEEAEESYTKQSKELGLEKEKTWFDLKETLRLEYRNAIKGTQGDAELETLITGMGGTGQPTECRIPLGETEMDEEAETMLQEKMQEQARQKQVREDKTLRLRKRERDRRKDEGFTVEEEKLNKDIQKAAEELSKVKSN